MFCRRPFEQFYVDETGDVHLCCPEWIAMPAGNVLATDPIKIWEGRVSGNIRRSIADQSFRHCIACPFLPGPAGCVTADPPSNLPVPLIDTLTMAYDPTCNLACPSCRKGPRGRSQRSREIQEILLGSGIFEKVVHLSSSGNGDPLASSLYWELLDRLPPDEYPALKLKLQTNGLLLDGKAWERLGEYAERVVELLVSVDAARAQTYREIRGGDWLRLEWNLQEIQRRQVPLQLNFVVQADNFLEMLEFVGMARSYGARRCYFSALDKWNEGAYDDDEYRKKAVHLPGHPEHQHLLRILQSPVLRDESYVTLARLP